MPPESQDQRSKFFIDVVGLHKYIFAFSNYGMQLRCRIAKNIQYLKVSE